MIERYTRPAMGRIWTLENRYRAWLAVEVAVCEAWAELGRVPAEAVKTIREKADIDVDRILEIEQTTRHDVIAFLTSLEEKVGPDARYIHLGCTSSDIVDTANGYLFMQAGKLIVEDIEKVLASLEALARKHKGVLCMGRTHGIHAEPTSFGLKMTGFHAEFQRHLERVKAGIESVRVGKISGAVGTYAFLSPELEEKALTRLLGKPPMVVGPVWAWPWTRTPPRSCSVTAMPISSPPWPSWPAASSACAWSCAICSAPRCWKWKKASPRARRAPRPCRTRRTPSPPRTWPALPA